MKLINILTFCLAILVCVSCSKDEDISIKDLSDAKLSIKVKASGPKGTKAEGDVNALQGEMNINNLAAVVFDKSGDYLLGDPVLVSQTSTNGEATLLNIPVKATIARIIIMANVPSTIFNNLTTYSEFKTRLAQLADQNVSNLTMSSQEIVSNKNLDKGDNYIGYESVTNINDINQPLELTRLAARIELASLETDFAGSSLAGRTVRINNVSIVNQKAASYYFSTEYWGAVMAPENLTSSALTTLGINLIPGTAVVNAPYHPYVMENTDATNPTQIVIDATVLASNGYQAITKQFAATINANGLATGKANHNYVKRNYIYRLNIRFTPTSFPSVPDEDPIPTPPPGPVTGDLTVVAEVAGWGPMIVQEPVIP